MRLDRIKDYTISSLGYGIEIFYQTRSTMKRLILTFAILLVSATTAFARRDRDRDFDGPPVMVERGEVLKVLTQALHDLNELDALASGNMSRRNRQLLRERI